jgi:Protein of unknown function (DUF3309)
MLGTILLVILILLLIGALPTWPYSRGWGYYPTSGLGLILIIVLLPDGPDLGAPGSFRPQPSRQDRSAGAVSPLSLPEGSRATQAASSPWRRSHRAHAETSTVQAQIDGFTCTDRFGVRPLPRTFCLIPQLRFPRCLRCRAEQAQQAVRDLLLQDLVAELAQHLVELRIALGFCSPPEGGL